jgi:hypothetical protein
MPSPPDNLIQPGQLSRFGVPSSFLEQFEARPFTVKIVTAGALGVMAFQWQFVGDSGWSKVYVSSAGASWSKTIDGAFADLTFAALNYALGALFNVDANGAVTGSAGLTAALFDMRAIGCSSVTREALIRMADGVTQPLLTWDDSVRAHAANAVHAFLKRSKGATALGAGDETIFIAEEKAWKFFDLIGSTGLPDSMTDSSTSADGPLIAVVDSDEPRGW